MHQKINSPYQGERSLLGVAYLKNKKFYLSIHPSLFALLQQNHPSRFRLLQTAEFHLILKEHVPQRDLDTKAELNRAMEFFLKKHQSRLDRDEHESSL